MPIPKPNAGEKQGAFISRCMGSDDLAKEFPDEKQRSAACLKAFREFAEAGTVNITEDFREIVEDVQVGTVKRLSDGKGIVIENAVLLSEFSKNKGPSGKLRRYPMATQEKSRLKFEGLEININHSLLNVGGQRGPRNILEKVGMVRNPRIRTITRKNKPVVQTVGDLHLIDVPEVDHIAKLIELDSKLGALSISASGDFRITKEHDEVVELDQQSLDIVGKGGTTRGMFEDLHADDDKDKKDGKDTGHKDNASSPSDSSDKLTAEANSFTDAAGQKSDSESHLAAMFAHYRAAGNLFFAGDLNRARAHVEKASDHETVAKNLAKQEPDAQGSQFPDMQNKGNVPPKPVEGDAQWVSALYENRPADWVESVYK